MNEVCNDEGQCNRPVNHDGEHGYVASSIPGLIIAPRRNMGKESPAVPCNLACLSCNGRMEMRQAAYGGKFDCLDCDEIYSFDEHGYTWKYATIFPSSDPHKYNPELKEEFIAYWRKKQSFMIEGLYLLGMNTTIERDTRLGQIAQLIAEWWDEDIKLPSKHHFWQFWKKARR